MSNAKKFWIVIGMIFLIMADYWLFKNAHCVFVGCKNMLYLFIGGMILVADLFVGLLLVIYTVLEFNTWLNSLGKISKKRHLWR